MINDTPLKVIIPYTPRSYQSYLHDELDKHRWSVLFIHRRFGKTVLLINHIIKAALQCDREAPRFAYMAPFLRQGKTLAWDYMKKYTAPIPGVEYNESELRVDLPLNGARIRIFGSDNADALRGMYLDGVVLDEYPLMSEQVFPSIIRPCLSDRTGFAIFSGTPNGKNHAYSLLQRAKEYGTNRGYFHCVLKASQTGVLSQEELDSARELMGDEAYNREYECSFESTSGKLVYPEFSSALHIATKSLLPSDPQDIVRGWDNTGLSPAIVLTYLNSIGQWCVFKEFTFDDTGIVDAAEAMLIWCNQHLHKDCRFTDYCDPAGRNRDSTKQSPRDYITKKAKELGYLVDLQNGIQTFKVRRDAVVSRLTKLVGGKPAIQIDPSCRVLIEGFEGSYKFKEIGNSGIYKSDPEKNHTSHIHDAVQYAASRLFSSMKIVAPKPVSYYMDRCANAGVW